MLIVEGALINKYLANIALKIMRLNSYDKGFEVKALEVGEMDHVHVFVSAPPRLSITNIVKYLKGISGRKLFECFPQLRNCRFTK